MHKENETENHPQELVLWTQFGATVHLSSSPTSVNSIAVVLMYQHALRRQQLCDLVFKGRRVRLSGGALDGNTVLPAEVLLKIPRDFSVARNSLH